MDYWLKQTKDQPLFPDLAWEMPEQRDQRGRLLIVGGNLHAFAAPATAYSAALSSGAGYARVCMPDALKRTIARVMPEVEYAPSTPSGSFSLKALESLLWQAQWAEGLLLAGDLGRNSETGIMLEKYVQSTVLPCAITKDALDYFTTNPGAVTYRPGTLLVGSFAQAQKLCKSLKLTTPLTFDMPLIKLVEALHLLSNSCTFSLITKRNDITLIAHHGRVITAQSSDEPDIWRLPTATKAIVSWLHFKDRPFQAYAHSLEFADTTDIR